MENIESGFGTNQNIGIATPTIYLFYALRNPRLALLFGLFFFNVFF